ncbi:hypothetical protein ASE23_20250 [Rhizobium sp. Root73]|nr:hypothetical protein ASE23_20250 [Rhizobium sp. Root73]
MILLPIERIMKHLDEDVVGYTDDRQLSPDVSRSIQERIRGKKLRNNAELAGFGWSFIPRTQVFQTSNELPEGIAKSLSSDEANASAQDMPMDQFISCLRNSLAHGGVMYLDQQGYSSRKAAEMLLFVSAKQTRPAPFVDEKTGKIIVPLPVTDGLRLLRIATRDFRLFLSSWTEWLDEVGILKEIAA